MSSVSPLPAPAEYGWKSVPRSQEAVLKLRPSGASAQARSLDNLPVPTTELAKNIQKYAQEELIPETFSHSMRVFHYGEFRHNESEREIQKADVILQCRQSYPQRPLSRMAGLR